MYRTPLRAALAAAVLVAGFGLAYAADKKDEGFTYLFNAKDMTGWKTFLSEKDADPTKTWTIKDEAVICSGKPSGYFYTDKPYSNYVLRYDWRYPKGSKEESNSGCLVHIQEPHKIWPMSVEPQGRYKDHGKLFFPGHPRGTGADAKFDEEALKKVRKEMGEWNTTEITCKGDGTIVVKVNGTEVASGKADIKSGPIGFQSEGAEIHFKNIRIKEMK